MNTDVKMLSFDSETCARLEQIAKETGFDDSVELIGILISTFISEYVATNEKANDADIIAH